MDAPIEQPTLLEIEQHIAWLYGTGLALVAEPALTRSEDVLVQILRETEATNEIVRRIDPLAFDLDAALDVAVVLSRALNVWDVSVKQWISETGRAALATAGKELVDAGLVLHDALASGPWVTPEDTPVAPSLRRTVQ
jgi:hypothetical protein